MSVISTQMAVQAANLASGISNSGNKTMIFKISYNLEKLWYIQQPTAASSQHSQQPSKQMQLQLLLVR